MISRKIRFPKFLDKAVTLSYDDGVKQDKRLIEIMKQKGLKGTFNLGSGMTEASQNHIKLDDLYSVYGESGMEVAVHGRGHLDLQKVSVLEGVDEILSDRKNLEKIFNRVVNGMAYAFGTYNDEIIDYLKICGIKYARTVNQTLGFSLPENWLEWHPTCRHKEPKLMELAKSFVEGPRDNMYWRQSLKVFYLWGHSYEFDNDDNWNVIEEFANYIGNRDDIWYATNGEICEYIKASERLQFTADGCYVYNPSAIPVYIEDFGKFVVAEPNATVKIK